MNSQPAQPVTVFGALRLERAWALLKQAEPSAPTRTVTSADELQALIDALCDLSSRDELTGLANRRSFEHALTRESDRVARSGEPALLLRIDIDHFDRIGYQHGRFAGETALKAVAQAMAATVRPMDLLASLRGEEFAVILPNCPPAFGANVAERLRQSVQSRTVALVDGASLGCTVSVGGAYAPQWVRSTPSVWLERAALQLYRAQSEGGDRACIEPTPVSVVSAEEKGLLFAIAASAQLGAPR